MPIHILIADDHAVFRSGLRVFLEKQSDIVVVGETGTGAETLEAIGTLPVDVLVLDITMPGMPGPRIAQEALSKRPSLAVIILTMHEDEYYFQELMRLGVRGYVLKKSTGEELVEAIRQVHRQEIYVDPALAGFEVPTRAGRDAAKGTARVGNLTPRELEVCRLLALGHTNAELAEKLGISDRTVETHRTNIMTKLQLKSRAELVRFAIDNGLLTAE